MKFGGGRKDPGRRGAGGASGRGESHRGAAKKAHKADAGLARLRNIPPPSPRRGINSQKEIDVRKEKRKAKRASAFKRMFKLVRAFIIVAVIAGGLGAAGWAGYQAFERNGMLVLRNIDVVGNRLVGKKEILEKAGLELGVKLTEVPVREVEASLRTLPGIADVDVRRYFPSRVEIRVKEKEPVAMGYSKGWYGLAPDGARIAGLDWAQSDLPVVDGFAGMDTVTRARLGRFLDQAKRSYPALYANFSQLALRGGDGLEIILRDGRLKVLFDIAGSAAEAMTAGLPGSGASARMSGYVDNSDANKSLNSLEFLQALIRQQGSALEPGKTVDLRVEGYAYVR